MADLTIPKPLPEEKYIYGDVAHNHGLYDDAADRSPFMQALRVANFYYRVMDNTRNIDDITVGIDPEDGDWVTEGPETSGIWKATRFLGQARSALGQIVDESIVIDGLEYVWVCRLAIHEQSVPSLQLGTSVLSEVYEKLWELFNLFALGITALPPPEVTGTVYTGVSMDTDGTSHVGPTTVIEHGGYPGHVITLQHLDDPLNLESAALSGSSYLPFARSPSLGNNIGVKFSLGARRNTFPFDPPSPTANRDILTLRKEEEEDAFHYPATGTIASIGIPVRTGYVNNVLQVRRLKELFVDVRIAFSAPETVRGLYPGESFEFTVIPEYTVTTEPEEFMGAVTFVAFPATGTVDEDLESLDQKISVPFDMAFEFDEQVFEDFRPRSDLPSSASRVATLSERLFDSTVQSPYFPGQESNTMYRNGISKVVFSMAFSQVIDEQFWQDVDGFIHVGAPPL
jgi:hypothetical protein